MHGFYEVEPYDFANIQLFLKHKTSNFIWFNLIRKLDETSGFPRLKQFQLAMSL